MSNDAKCPECGAPLAANAPGGLCPSCLMALNLKTETMFSDDAPTAQPPLPPEQIAPHFPQLEILECLGRGGMGVVYKARQKSLNRFVALKLLAPERVGDPKFAERFAREAQALAALNHPNIVTIHDFGQAGGFYFLLMEFVDGANLRHLLRAQKFTPEEALAIVPPLCEALQYAHERGIVHRDIKPENLLLDKTGRVKIADFGIAKMLGTGDGGAAGGSPATGDATTQSALGTRGYSAPEQQNTPQRVDNRADIYSLGVVLYEMLTGELPGKSIEPPSKKVHIDVRLDAVVLRALEKTPELRWQTAAEMRTQVETIAQTTGEVEESGVPDSVVKAKPGLGHGMGIGIGLLVLAICLLLLAFIFREKTMDASPEILQFTNGHTVEQFADSPVVQSWRRLIFLERVFTTLGLVAIVAGTLLACLSVFRPLQRGPKGTAPLQSVYAWLALFDKGDYGGSWEAAANYFKHRVTKAEWVERGNVTRQPLGRVISRKVRKVRRFAKLFSVKYDTVFAGLKSAVETVTFSRERDGEWRAIGYLILPAYAEEDRTKKHAREAIIFSGLATCVSVIALCNWPRPTFYMMWAMPVLALAGIIYGLRAKEHRFGRIGIRLGMANLALWVIAAALLFFWAVAPGGSTIDLADSPQILRVTPTAGVIQAGLSKPLTPWAWQELEQRQLTTNDVTQVMDGVTAWLQREFPEGESQPINWLDNFLNDLAGKGLVTDDQKVRFLQALNGELRGDPLFRLREGDDRLEMDMECRYIWGHDLLGMEMMNEMESATVDGQPLKLNMGFGKNWDMEDLMETWELPRLPVGTHQFKLKVLSALVAKDDLTGLAQDAPSADWPSAKKRWVRTAVRELTVYPRDAVIVNLTENPALDPVSNGSLDIKQAIIRSKGGQGEATLSFGISNNLPVNISFDVALRFAGQTVPCGKLWATKNREGQFSTGNTELTADLAVPGPEIQTADIVLAPDPKPVEDIGTVDCIWGHKIVFSGIALKRLDLDRNTAARDEPYFGPVHHVTLDDSGHASFLNLDTGEIMAAFAGNAADLENWKQAKDISLSLVKSASGLNRIAGSGMNVSQVSSDRWETMKPEELIHASDTNEAEGFTTNAVLETGHVYIFGTAAPGIGLLRADGSPGGDEHRVNISYKMVQVPMTFGPVIEYVLDLTNQDHRALSLASGNFVAPTNAGVALDEPDMWRVAGADLYLADNGQVVALDMHFWDDSNTEEKDVPPGAVNPWAWVENSNSLIWWLEKHPFYGFDTNSPDHLVFVAAFIADQARRQKGAMDTIRGTNICFFTTRQGVGGVLQIGGYTGDPDKPSAVKIRYRLAQNQ